MNSTSSRRRFLQAAAATPALAAANTTAPAPPAWHGGSRTAQVATNCEMCFWRCGVLAQVTEGKVVRVEGNPDHPLTHGRLCARGNAGVDLLYDPDRLKYPMLRTGARGEGKFERISWTRALDLLAGRLRELKTKFGPESVALFPHGVASSFFSTLMKAYGTPNSAEPAFAQCRGPREVGYALTFGQGLGSPEPVDLEESKMIVLIGSHLGENVFTSQITAFAEGLSRGAQLVVVDPRFSAAAAKADWWLPIRPGTDIALLLAWIHVLITESLCDAEYLARHASGLAELSAHVREFTPEWAEEQTEIPAGQIRETARAMGAAKPAVVVHPGRHVTWYGDDTQRARAMAILTALLGSWGRKGGIFLPTPLPRGKFQIPAFPESKRGRADGAGTTYPLASEEQGVTNGLVEATLTGKPYPIKAWIIYGQNVLESIPQRQKTLRAMEKLDFIVAVDVMPMEQINYADLVLPEATYLERYDMPAMVETAKTPYVATRFPVIAPRHDTRAGWWIAKQLASRLELDAYFPWQTPEEHLAKLVEPLHTTVAALQVRGAVSLPGRPYIEDRLLTDGPLFATESGKIELYSHTLKSLGFDPLPRFTAPADPPPGSFRLIYGRSPVHSFARTQNNAALHALMSENELWIHTHSARDAGVGDGDRVRLQNTDGVLGGQVRVKVTEGIRRDCVYLVHGFGHKSKAMQKANGRGASDTEMISRVKVDPIMGATGMRVTFVRLIKGEAES